MKLKRVTSFILVLTVLVSCVAFMPPVKVQATGEWATVNIYQKEVGHDSGCTVCTYQLILQNSGTLKSEWQLSGEIHSRTSEYASFDDKCGELRLNSGDGVYYDSLPSVANTLCIDGVEWTYGFDEVTGQTPVDGGYFPSGSKAKIVGGAGGKRFDAMSDSEVITVMKAFWNAGYWCVMGIYFDNDPRYNNGNESYQANHWVMFAGVDDAGVYMNDPIYGSSKMEDVQNGHYRLRYIVPIKCNQASPLSVSGGKLANVTQTDRINAAALGLSSNFITGQMASDQWASSLMLAESDFSGVLPTSVENLKQDDRESLAAWQMNVESDKLSLIDIIRTLVVFVGIIFTLWGILIYLAYWFDHINTIFYVDVLHLVTFGQLHICPPGEKPTFHMGKEKKDRTVSHKQIVCISGMCVLSGVLLISGTFYTIVQKFVRLITSFLS